MKGWAEGNQAHEAMVDLVQMYCSMSLFKDADIEFIQGYEEDEYIYDLYIPKYDLPIEIGANKEAKLNYLLNNKRIFCLVLLDGRVSYRLDWLNSGNINKPVPKVMWHRYKCLEMIFITRHDIPGFETLVERVGKTLGD